jgi:putative serine protease PepD
VKPPKHLWTGDWRSRRDEQAPPVPPLRPPPVRPQAEPEPRRRRRGPAILAAIFGVLVFVAAAFVAGGLLRGDDPPPLPESRQGNLRPRGGQTRIGAIYASASPAVVSVRTNTGTGTGFLVDRQGTLVTNAHVIGSSGDVAVRFGPNGRSIDARVLGTDPSSDLAVLKISGGDTPNVRPLGFADSSRVRIGDRAVAIGNPFGLDRTATAGIVSGLRREIRAPNGYQIDEVIQTDAPINPGNSGGPLLDTNGRVIGVNSQIATGGAQGNVGIGFAVPSNTVRQVVPRLKQGQTIERPYLGVSTGPASPTSPDGARVRSVEPGSPAQRGGLQVDDVITSIEGRRIDDPADVSAAVNDRSPGDHVTVEVRRDGQPVSLDVELGTRPAKQGP